MQVLMVTFKIQSIMFGDKGLSEYDVRNIEFHKNASKSETKKATVAKSFEIVIHNVIIERKIIIQQNQNIYYAEVENT